MVHVVKRRVAPPPSPSRGRNARPLDRRAVEPPTGGRARAHRRASRAATFANNFLLANAVYDADRIGGETPWWHRNRTLTRVTAMAMSYYGSTPATAPLAPVVRGAAPRLRAVKRPIAPVRPPLSPRPGRSRSTTAALAAALADTRRRDARVAVPCHGALAPRPCTRHWRGRALGLRTPAVALGAPRARAFATCLALGAMCPRAPALGQRPGGRRVALCRRGRPGRGRAVRRGRGGGVGGLVHTLTEWLTIAIVASRQTHDWAIEAMVRAVDALQPLPSSVRAPCLDALFTLVHAGDAVGSAMLHLYEQSVRAM